MPTRYGLGISVGMRNGEKVLEHSGEVGGFVAENIVFPDEKLAIAVLTNQEASSAASDIMRAILPLVSAPKQVAAKQEVSPEETALRSILTGLQDGQINRKLFTADANYYFSAQTLGDFASSLKPLGAIVGVSKTSESLRGGMTFRTFDVAFAGGTSVTTSTYTMADGRLEQLLVEEKK